MSASASRPAGLWRRFFRPRSTDRASDPPPVAAPPTPSMQFSFDPDDPVLEYFQHSPGVVDLEHLPITSPAVDAMRAAGCELVVPLVSQGEILGVLSLGPRMSQQEYSLDDRRLLNSLATQAAPAVRVAQLVQLQQEEARERERLARELQIASLIQHTLLPRTVPTVDGYHVQTYYQPAREVGGDFYDFLTLDDGRLGLVIGDVTDKGVPAALVMATTRSVMRGVAAEIASPGKVLARVNDLLCPDVPTNMFVTCFYAVLEPRSGRMVYANAGHDLPYWRRGTEASELRARGMPLGLMPGMQYEEKVANLDPGDMVMLYSDGIAEAHNSTREMFGFPRVRETVAEFRETDESNLVDHVLAALADFTGANWEQEDDITMVTVRCLARSTEAAREEATQVTQHTSEEAWESLAEFQLPSAPGNERAAIKRVMEILAPVQLSPESADRLKTAIGEVTMNAMEHGNAFQENNPVVIQVLRAGSRIAVRITDSGHGWSETTREAPDLEAKLAGLQSPRGWGLFLIERMVDEMHEYADERGHTVELVANAG